MEALVEHKWNVDLYINTLIMYVNNATPPTKTSNLDHNWLEGWSDHVDKWEVVLSIILEMPNKHPEVFKTTDLISIVDEFSTRLRTQAYLQNDMMEYLLRLIETEFNKSFFQVFKSLLPVCWPHLSTLTHMLTTGYFQYDCVVITVGYQESTQH